MPDTLDARYCKGPILRRLVTLKAWYSEGSLLRRPRRGSRGGFGPPPPLEFSKYISQRTTFKDFCWRYQGVILHACFSKFSGSLRWTVTVSYLTRMKVHVYVPSLGTVRRFCRLPWKFQGYALFIYFLHLCRTTKTLDIIIFQYTRTPTPTKVRVFVQRIFKTVNF